MAFKKFPKLKRVGHPSTQKLLEDSEHELVITEKLDGNNFRFTYDPDADAIRFGSRNVDLGTDVGEIGGQFDAVSDYLVETVSLGVLKRLHQEYDGIVIFGENAIEHTIGDYTDEMPQYNVFDVFVGTEVTESHDGRQWLPWSQVEQVANELGLDTVPVVEWTTVDVFTPNEYEIPESRYRIGNGTAEGVVVRNTHNQERAKMISEEFAELHRSAKSKNNYDYSDIGRFVTTYCPPQRIKKRALALRDDPDSKYDALEMEMMEVLATDVWNDLWEEEWEEIIYEDYELDIGDARSAVSSKTASILRDMIRDRRAGEGM